jgi:hypothetical protein
MLTTTSFFSTSASTAVTPLVAVKILLTADLHPPQDIPTLNSNFYTNQGQHGLRVYQEAAAIIIWQTLIAALVSMLEVEAAIRSVRALKRQTKERTRTRW